jgi:large subunit ribosomal protein L32
MAVPKRKTSKMKVRSRKAANRYKGVQLTACTECKAPAAPHRVCPSCGMYKGKQVLTVSE